MSTTRFRRKPEVIKFNGKLINFASLCPNQINVSDIEWNNGRLFELFNPENKYQLSMGFNLFNKYSKVFKEFSFQLFKLNSLATLFFKYNSLTNKSFVKKEILANDPLEVNNTRNEIRTAFIEDLKCKVSLVFTDNTINCMDFCFDTIKDYSDNKIEGIQLNENGFLNPSKFTVTIFINKKYLAEYIENPDYDDRVYIQDIRLSLFASIFRDGYRIEMTEKFMVILNLLAASDFTFLNTSSSQYVSYNDERYKNISKEFKETYSDIFKIIGEDEEFVKLIKLLNGISANINPLNILSLIEPSNKSLGSLLKIEFRDPEEKINKFISSFDLYETDENNIIDNVKKAILTARILPLLQFTTYYLQNSENYKTYKIIDKTLEDFIHDYMYHSTSYYFDSLRYTHINNDDFYDNMRKVFRNPMKNTRNVLNGFNECILPKYSVNECPVAE